MVLGHIQPVIHTLCSFIHQTYTLHMSYTRYWAIFNRWYIACTILNIRHIPCTCRIRGIGPYSTGDTYLVHFYTPDIHLVHVIYAVLGHIPMVIHGLYTFIHQTYTLYMLYTRYWSIFNRWYMTCTFLYIRHSPCTCRIHGIGPYSTGDTYPVHIYTSDVYPVHVVYAVLGHIQPVIHSLYTFIHQTFTLYMSYAWYWAIFNRWYIPCALYTSDIHPVHVEYALLGHIPMVIHGLYTFIHEIYTLYMLYTRYWSIFNHWYIAYTLLYIRHSPCTCRIHVIGPYSTGDTYPVHFYTSDIHPVHIVYTVLGHIQPLIHSLYTFIHQTFTLHMSYTRYCAIFNRWYIPCTLLYIRHTQCTCRIRSIGPYSTGDT